MAVVRALQGETLASLVWRSIGVTPGVVEAVLEANPGLAEFAEALPQGHPVTFPDVVAKAQTQAEAVLTQLWD